MSDHTLELLLTLSLAAVVIGVIFEGAEFVEEIREHGWQFKNGWKLLQKIGFAILVVGLVVESWSSTIIHDRDSGRIILLGADTRSLSAVSTKAKSDAAKALVDSGTATTAAQTTADQIRDLQPKITDLTNRENALREGLAKDDARIGSAESTLNQHDARLTAAKGDIAKLENDTVLLKDVTGRRHLDSAVATQLTDIARRFPPQNFSVQSERSMGAMRLVVDIQLALKAGGWKDVGDKTPRLEGVSADGIQVYCAASAPMSAAAISCSAIGSTLNDWMERETGGFASFAMKLPPSFPQDIMLIVVGTRP